MSKAYEIQMSFESKMVLKPGPRFSRAHSFDGDKTLAIWEDSGGNIFIKVSEYTPDGNENFAMMCLNPDSLKTLYKYLGEYYEGWTNPDGTKVIPNSGKYFETKVPLTKLNIKEGRKNGKKG